MKRKKRTSNRIRLAFFSVAIVSLLIGTIIGFNTSQAIVNVGHGATEIAGGVFGTGNFQFQGGVGIKKPVGPEQDIALDVADNIYIDHDKSVAGRGRLWISSETNDVNIVPKGPNGLVVISEFGSPGKGNLIVNGYTTVDETLTGRDIVATNSLKINEQDVCEKDGNNCPPGRVLGGGIDHQFGPCTNMWGTGTCPSDIFACQPGAIRRISGYLGATDVVYLCIT